MEITEVVIGYKLSKFKSERAAVVPYLIKDGILHFLFAIDKKSGDVTDMGGGVKKGEYALDAAIREFKEESGGIFGDMYSKVNDMGCFLGLIGQRGKMSSLFIPVKETWYDNTSILNPSIEVEKMVWLSEKQLIMLLTYQKRSNDNMRMWNRPKRFYNNVFTEQFKNKLKVVYKMKQL